MTNPSENTDSASQAPAERPQNGEEVLDAISAVESQLASLKKAAAERRQRDAELLARETALKERETAFQAQIADIERDLAVIEQAREAIAAERAQFEDRNRQHEAELADRESKIEQAMSSLESREAEARERSSKLESRAQELERAEARLTDQANELGQRVRALEQRANKATEDLQAALARSEQAEAERDAANEAREQAEQAVRTLEAALARAQEESQAVIDSVEESESAISTLTAHAEQLNQQAATLRAELESRAAELEAAQAECARVERDAADRLASFDKNLAAAEERASAAESELAQQREQVEHLESQAQALAQHLEKIRAEGASTLDQIDEREAELRSQIEQRDRAIAERDEVVQSLRSKLATATEKITQFGEFIKTQVPGGDGKHAAALSKAVAENEALQTRIGELHEQIDALRDERDRLASGHAGATRVVERSDDFIQLRRERLARMRKHLRLQSRKVRRANELLQDRFGQCESLLSRRAELAAAHQEIQEQRAKTVGRRAASSAAGAVLALIVVVGVLIGLSWVAAEQVHPSVYAATAIISADSGDRTLTDGAREEWQQYHEGLFEDPRFIETLAEMLKRRGLGALGTPAATQEALAAGFTLASPVDGQLQLEYRGQGSTRTERILDTIAVGVARTANRTRSRRTDGAMSVVSKPAEVGRDPIESNRLVYAAAIFGGGMCLSLTFGAVVWRRMASAKSTFEHDQQLQALLSEARWQDPRIDIDAGESQPTVEPADDETRDRKRRRKPSAG